MVPDPQRVPDTAKMFRW